MINRVEVWDGWRGLAICCVLIGHFCSIPNMGEHRLGVDIFFVLSGMLMSGILFEQRMPLKKFYLRRFSRIFPALAVFVVFWYLASLQLGMEYQWRELIANLTFIRTYYPADPHIWEGSPMMGHLWSLNVEEHAYIIMSAITLIAVSRRRAALLLTVLGLGAIAISMLYYFYPNLSYSGPEFQLRTESAISFIFLSAAYNLIRKRYHISAAGWQPVLALLVASLCYIYSVPLWITFSVTPILLAYSVNHLQDAAQWFQSLLSNRMLRQMGIWSYSIYLWQQPFYKGSHDLPGGNATGLLLSIILGICSYYLIEQPLRTRINNYWSNRTKARASLPVNQGASMKRSA